MKLNDVLPDFNLKGTDGKFYSVNEFDKFKCLVVIVTCNHCPYARAYISRIRDLGEKIATKSVKIIAVNPNDAARYPQDSFENMIPMAGSSGLNCLYLHDEKQEFVKALEASRTPEVFVFNNDRKLVYTGAFDDNWEQPAKVTRSFVEEAIQAALNNAKISTSITQAVGCSVKWKI